ncbi:MAG: hypothetical protein U7126_10520 [Microcoleus sp.]
MSHCRLLVGRNPLASSYGEVQTNSFSIWTLDKKDDVRRVNYDSVGELRYTSGVCSSGDRI